ncbi:type I DNA topoisomerase, partial [Patescibacteria group bacterium]|nr:type I DNA topoisomerase [Patescibacteria group bacterium]
LWKKVRFGLSAGRVQSVAVRLVVEKERERDAFVPVEYWSCDVDFETKSKEKFKAELDKKDGKKLEISNQEQSAEIKSDILKDDTTFSVTEVKKSERKRNPSPPLKTSTLQQVAANVFGFPAKKTMSVAQKLFEKGLITYHRTDSLNLSPQFLSAVHEHVAKHYGKRLLPEVPIEYKTKSANAQEAHEAIRPTDLNTLPLDLDTVEEQKVYLLIYKRAVESQMLPAVYDQTTIIVGSSNGYEFRASGSVIKFEGWLALGKKLGMNGDGEQITVLPDVKEKDDLKLLDTLMEQHFTQPPARYSDATLIKELEEMGIGRPSTYAPTLSTIQARGYVEKDGRYYKPTDVAFVVTDLLIKHFSNIVDYKFTAGMEEDLDAIAEDKKQWVPVIREFYTPFEKIVVAKDKELHKQDVTNLGNVGEKCPDCGKELVYKLGKYGKFVSCSNYPDCEYARPLEQDIPRDAEGNEITDFGKCEVCETGIYVLKKGRFGKFLACSNYPKCKTTKPYLDKIGMKCPKCVEGEVVIKKAKRREFFGCSRYPDCDYSSWKNPLAQEKSEEIETLDLSQVSSNDALDAKTA